MKRKKKYIGVKFIFLIGFLAILVGSILLITDNIKINKQINEKKLKGKREQEQLEIVKSHYDNYVITNKTCDLYELKNNEYNKVGKISNSFHIFLDSIDIKYDTEFFKIKDSDNYIKYDCVDKSDEFKIDDRYKKYVVFNENVVTKDETTFFRNDESYITINKSFDLPIYIKDNDKYYVVLNNELFYVKKDSVEKTKQSSNTKQATRNNIRVLTYHTIYDKKTQNCTNSAICHSIEQFDSHMKYLSENNYFTLTMNELEMFLDKKIQIPKKSIVITLDDGKYAINAVNIVEKYKVNATYFMITSRYKIPDVKTTYMNFQSHTHNLHNNWKCSGGNQGGQLLCEDENKILEDLKTNKEIIGGDVFAFAYPFFDYNERAIKLLKKSGFRLAFIGQYNTDGYSTYTTDRLLLRRKTIFATDSLETFISRLV